MGGPLYALDLWLPVVQTVVQSISFFVGFSFGGEEHKMTRCKSLRNECNKCYFGRETQFSISPSILHVGAFSKWFPLSFVKLKEVNFLHKRISTLYSEHVATLLNLYCTQKSHVLHCNFVSIQFFDHVWILFL